MRRLVNSPYQLVISCAHLAAKHNFLFLKKNQALQPTVPFLVNASAPDQEMARQALQLGAFGIIPSPENADETASMIMSTMVRVIALAR